MKNICKHYDIPLKLGMCVDCGKTFQYCPVCEGDRKQCILCEDTAKARERRGNLVYSIRKRMDLSQKAFAEEWLNISQATLSRLERTAEIPFDIYARVLIIQGILDEDVSCFSKNYLKRERRKHNAKQH